MKHKRVSRNLSTRANKSLSKWDEAILEAKRQISELKLSVQAFQEMRDTGVPFPEPQKGVLSQPKDL